MAKYYCQFRNRTYSINLCTAFITNYLIHSRPMQLNSGNFGDFVWSDHRPISANLATKPQNSLV